MKLTTFTLATIATAALPLFSTARQQMVKMCLFYDRPSGHARSDPIINQECTSSHVHTFYGPRSFHPSTTYSDLLSTPGHMSTSPYVENKSLYWHPSIYRVDSEGVHTRVDNLEFGPYYRWDKSVSPTVEPFPPGFRMIAASNDPGACGYGENCPEDNFVAMFTECCDISADDEICSTWEGELRFPRTNCDFLGIALAMPTCWNGEEDSYDHKSHVAYTTNGLVNGDCPPTHTRRLPQVQVFIRIPSYRGASYKYVLSDGNSIPGKLRSYHFHTDFFNGWEEGKFQEIMNNCLPSSNQEDGDYNPPCDCTPDSEDSTYDGGLTINTNVPETVCDADVKRLIVDEEIANTANLPVYSESCQGAQLIQRSWTELTLDLYSTDCDDPISTTSTSTTSSSSSSTSSSSVTTQSPPTSTTTTINSGCPSGSKVKIFSLYGKPIQMFEVQVISSGMNVAQGKLAFQSSTLKDKFDASKAVDGNSNSFSHTKGGLPWWEVDLGGSYPIESVHIANRWCRNSDDPLGCLCRLSHSVVSIVDESSDWVASQFLGDTCGQLEVDIEFQCSV